MTPKLRRDLMIATEGRQIIVARDTLRQPFMLTASVSSRDGARAGSSVGPGDSSRIVELTNASAYSQQNKLPLPSGLIAYRPAAAAPHARKIGAYKYQAGNIPGLLVVMSLEEQGGAEILLLSIVNGKGWWSFVRGSLSNDQLECTDRDGGPKHVFAWSDANGGSLTIYPEAQATGQSRMINGRFTRLDG